MPTAIFNLCFPVWANYHCVRGSHLFMSPFPDNTLGPWRSLWMSLQCPHRLSLTTSWSRCWPLVSVWSLVTVICARAAGHCKTDEASPVSRWRGPSDAGISRPAAALCRLARPGPRQGSDYQFTLVRGSARQHINSDPRPTTQELTPWDSLPATDTRGEGGVINSGALK